MNLPHPHTYSPPSVNILQGKLLLLVCDPCCCRASLVRLRAHFQIQYAWTRIDGSQIFQDNNTTHARVYSYHYIYDYLFVQVTEEQYEREYARRIRTFQRCDPLE